MKYIKPSMNFYYLIPLFSFLWLALFKGTLIHSNLEFISFLVILFVCTAFGWFFQKIHAIRNKLPAELITEYLPVFLGFITLAFILCMVVVSKTNASVHPDEFTHISVARYYYDHWLPPKIGSPETLSTYSVWGFSYITEFDVVYLLAAKFSLLIRPLIDNEVIALRLFQVMLFALIAGSCLLSSSLRWVSLPLLMTPQVWYVYSYFNADAFPLTVSVILIGLLFGNGRSMMSLLNGPRWKIFVSILTILLSLLILSKRNYWPIFIFIFTAQLILIARLSALKTFIFGLGFALFVIGFMSSGISFGDSGQLSPYSKEIRQLLMLTGFLCTITSLFGNKYWLSWCFDNPKLCYRIVLMLAMIGLIVGIRIIYDASINGGFASRSSMINDLAESLAGPGFKPSMYASASAHHSLALAAHGVSVIETLFAPWDWILKIVNSFFGVYSYMNIRAMPHVYLILKLLFGIFFVGASLVVFSRKKQNYKPLLVLCYWIILIVAISSFFLSWVNAFQAQGRYLFPILPLLGVLLLIASKNERFIIFARSILISAWGVSAYSFLFIGLTMIPKQ